MILKYFDIARQIIEELEPMDFRVQQFQRFMATDLRILNHSQLGDIRDFLKSAKRQRRGRPDQAVIRKIRVNLEDFF